MNRFLAALSSVDDPAPSIVSLSSNFYNAVMEAYMYDKNPATDPAVLLLSMQINFVTHVDCATSTMYDSLVETCRMNAGKAHLTPMEIH